MNEGLNGADVDDAPLGRAQLLQKGVCHIEYAIEIHGQDVLPILHDRFRVSGEAVAAVDPGIVDQDRDGPGLCLNLSGDLAAVLTLGHIEPEGCGLAAADGDRFGRLARRVAVNVDRGDLRPLFGIGQGDGTPDA